MPTKYAKSILNGLKNPRQSLKNQSVSESQKVRLDGLQLKFKNYSNHL